MKIQIENFNSNLNKRGFDINNSMDFMLIDIEIKGPHSTGNCNAFLN